MAGSNSPGTTMMGGPAGGNQPVNQSELNDLMQGAYGQGYTPNYGAYPGQDQMVYMGKGYERPGGGLPPKKGSSGAWNRGDTGMRPIAWAKNEYLSMGPAEREIWQAYAMHTAGFIPSDFNGPGYWENLLGQVAQYQTNTGEKISPWEFMIKRMEETPPTRRGGGGSSGGPRAIVDLTNPMDAEVLVDNALSEYLGRQANDQEITNFVNTLNRLQRRNPRIVSKSGTSGGINPQLVAQEYAMSRPNAAEHEAVTQYLGWMTEALMADPYGGMSSGL